MKRRGANCETLVNPANVYVYGATAIAAGVLPNRQMRAAIIITFRV